MSSEEPSASPLPRSLQQAKILVTGGSGLVGRAIEKVRAMRRGVKAAVGL